MLLVASSAQAARVYQYLDDNGDIHYTQDPGTVPLVYRDRIIEAPDASPEQRSGTASQAQERLRDMFDFKSKPLPPKLDAPTLLHQGTADTPLDATSSGAPVNAGAQTPPDLDLDKLRERLGKLKGDRLMQRLVIAQVASFQSGFFWVALLAIVLFGFILGTRSLISLEDSKRKRLFWKWGFPFLSVATIGILFKWTYPKYLQLYTDLTRALGI